MKGFEVELQEPKLKVRDERAIRKELADLKEPDDEGGEVIKPERVVERARDAKSAMHSQFEWDDTVAGHQWRLVQARALIRRIIVVMPDDKSETLVPKYVSLVSDRRKPGGGYRETAEVLSNEELLAKLEDTLKRDLEGVLRRYEPLKDIVARIRKAAGIRPRTAPKKG